MKLVIATPVDGDATTGQVAAGYASALANLARDNGAALGVVPTQITYSYDICRARNKVTAWVLRDRPDATHVLWWDSDVVPHDLTVVGSMLATGHDVVSCPYLRKRHPRFAKTWAHQPAPVARMVGQCELVEGVPFGFTITSVDCLRRMSDWYAQDLTYTDVESSGSRHPVVGLFNLAWHVEASGDRYLLSEDYSFSQRWRAMGGAVYLYCGPGNQLGHVGNHEWIMEAK